MARYNFEFRKSEFTCYQRHRGARERCKTYRCARAGTVMMASHGVVTQSTIYLSGSLEWSPEHMNSTVPTCTCESRARRFRPHSMGMMGGQSSVALHSVCELKYAGAQGMSFSCFMRMPQLQGSIRLPKNEIKRYFTHFGDREAQGRLWVGLGQHSGDS